MLNFVTESITSLLNQLINQSINQSNSFRRLVKFVKREILVLLTTGAKTLVNVLDMNVFVYTKVYLHSFLKNFYFKLVYPWILIFALFLLSVKLLFLLSVE